MAADQPVTAQPKRGPGTTALAVMLVGLVLVACFVIYAIWVFWPTTAALDAGEKTIRFLGMSREHVGSEYLLFIIVALAGALGGLMHAMRSFAYYAGLKGLEWQWLPYYFLMPILGAAAGTVVYVLVRGGILGGQAPTDAINPYSSAALAALVGLFTEEALEMLKKVATQIFAKAPENVEEAAAQQEQQTEEQQTEEQQTEETTEEETTEEETTEGETTEEETTEEETTEGETTEEETTEEETTEGETTEGETTEGETTEGETTEAETTEGETTEGVTTEGEAAEGEAAEGETTEEETTESEAAEGETTEEETTEGETADEEGEEKGNRSSRRPH